MSTDTYACGGHVGTTGGLWYERAELLGVFKWIRPARFMVRIPLSPPHPFVQDGERARIGVNRHAERLRHAGGGDVIVGRSCRRMPGGMVK